MRMLVGRIASACSGDDSGESASVELPPPHPVMSDRSEGSVRLMNDFMWALFQLTDVAARTMPPDVGLFGAKDWHLGAFRRQLRLPAATRQHEILPVIS